MKWCLSYKSEISRLQLEVVPLESMRANYRSFGVELIWMVLLSQRSGSSILIISCVSCSILSFQSNLQCICFGARDYIPLIIYPSTCCIKHVTSWSRRSPCSSRVSIRGTTKLMSCGLVSTNSSGRVLIIAWLRVVSINEEVVSIDVALFALRILCSS